MKQQLQRREYDEVRFRSAAKPVGSGAESGGGTEERAISTCDGVIDIFSALFGIPGRDIRSRNRENRTVAQTRHMAMYVAHVVLGLTMREVGLGFGRDRTSVVYACHLVEDMRDDVAFDQLVAMAERVVSAAFARQTQA